MKSNSVQFFGDTRSFEQRSRLSGNAIRESLLEREVLFEVKRTV
jgi:hypothetical protein